MESSCWEYDETPSDDACREKVDGQVSTLASGRTAVPLYDHAENQGCCTAEEWTGSEMVHPGRTPCIVVSKLSESMQDSGQILMQDTPRELRLRSWDHKRGLEKSGQDPTWAPGS